MLKSTRRRKAESVVTAEEVASKLRHDLLIMTQTAV
jgi:hypothetical protein